MKLRDFVVNSLPRVRGKKKSRGNPPPETSGKSRHDTPPRPPVRISSMSRESSVERASHVAVADVNWRQSPPRMGQDDVSLKGSVTYYKPPPGMVMSHSAEGISFHSMALVTSHGPALEYNGPYSQISAISENAVNYSMPKGFVFQSQHHHRHSHQHDYHYVYHHHHHHQYSPDPTQKAPLVENKYIHNASRCKPHSTPNKPEPGFLRKSFASFKAMRKQRNNAKDAAVVKTKTGDENGKCSVCPYPQILAQGADAKKTVDTRPAKPKRKGLKSLRKSKPNQEEQLDKSWFSDNDSCKAPSHHLSDIDLLYQSSNQSRRYRECSVESCMSRLYGSQDGSCGPENDFRGLDSHSLSGYESDLPRSKTGRTRSRIKTNPWLPSPQPSLNIGRRFEQSDFRESREDVMTVDDDYPSIPRSASFEHQRPAVLSSFQTMSAKGRPVQRHRSLTPSDLKMTLSLKAKSAEAQPLLSISSQPLAQECKEETQMNNLSVAVSKSRPSSIISPASEFIILADNIEQLANNISFEYEDMLESTLESVSPYHDDGKISVQELFTDEELMGSVKNNEIVFPGAGQVNATAHSPDSGIGCLGSSDGDELVMANAVSSGQSSPPSSAHCVTPIANGGTNVSEEEIKNSSNISEPNKNGPENSPHTEEFPGLQNIHSQFSLPQNSDHIQPFSFSAMGETGCSGPISTASANGCIVEDSTLGKDSLDHTIRTHELDFKEESSEMNCSPHQRRQSPLSEKTNKAQTHLRKGAKGTSSDTDLVDGPSLILNKRFNSQSTDLKDFHEEVEIKSFSIAKFQTRCGETLQLPPNIISSELTTPVESPTENWQCDIAYLSQLKTNSDSHVLNTQHGQMNSPVADKNSEKPFYSVQNSSESGRINTNEKNVEFTEITLPDHACQSDSEQLSYSTGSNCPEWVDVSVQTDFNDQDFDSWHESPSEALGGLCNEDFDPLESTRRWLLTGNMQGSADTGYSSQPRDSQILMDDDDSISAFDSFNESKTIFTKGQMVTEESVSKLTCSATLDPSKGVHLEVTTNGGEQVQISGEHCPLQSSKGKEKSQSDDLIYSMFSGIESQFQDIFHQLWPSQKMVENTANKRDSSGSSTSTLISENIGITAISPAVSSEQSGSDERTPKNSGYESTDHEYVDMKNSACLLGKKVPKKQKTVTTLEPDYVNVPRKGHSVKSSTGHLWARSDSKTKDHSGNVKKCSVRSYPQNIDPCHYESKVSSSSPLWINKAGMMSTERADYLEFLRDAPLNNAHKKRPMFLIPGFGPIDMSSASVNLLTKTGCTPASSSQCQTSKGVRTRSSASDMSTVHRVQSLISEGRAGARMKWSHNKEHLGYPLVNKNHFNVSHNPSKGGQKALPDKPKRKNPRALQAQPLPNQSQWNSNNFSGPLRGCSPPFQAAPFQAAPFQPSTSSESSTRSLAERVWQLQREKDLIYLQLKEVQQEELSRQRQQLQHHRNVHSQRKDVLLETLRELKANLEEQSRKLNLACNKDVYI